MKVTMATPYYPPHIGGVEVHVKNLAEGLKQRRYEVVVISSSGSNVVVNHLKVPYSPIPLTFPKLESDIYHSHVPSPFFAQKMGNLANIKEKPHIVTYHNDVIIPQRVNGYRIPHRVARLIKNINEKVLIPTLKKTDVIIATTKSYAETSSILSKFMNKVEIVPNAVNPHEFTPAKIKKDRTVLYVGRLVEYKGLSTLIRAMRDVDAKILAIGSGEDKSKFERLALKLGVNIKFLGNLKKSEIIEQMKRARVLVLPSFSRLEAFGIVLLEAMACQTPVIAGNTPGVCEIATNGGFTFSTKEELVEKLNLLLDDPRLAMKLGKKGRRAVEKKYAWDVVLKKIEKIYGEVL